MRGAPWPQPNSVPRAVSVLYGEEPPPERYMAWLPNQADFLHALKRQGYSDICTPGPPEEQACAEPVLAARLHNLALTLRLLPAAFAHEARAAESSRLNC